MAAAINQTIGGTVDHTIDQMANCAIEPTACLTCHLPEEPQQTDGGQPQDDRYHCSERRVERHPKILDREIHRRREQHHGDPDREVPERAHDGHRPLPVVAAFGTPVELTSDASANPPEQRLAQTGGRNGQRNRHVDDLTVGGRR